MRRGGCLCGAVRFEARDVGALGVCHCSQCLKWAGGPFMGVTVPAAGLTVHDQASVRTFASSSWASRSSCATCGSTLWYRASGALSFEIALGCFDDPNGLPVTREIYIDHKPDGVALAGEHPRLDAATVRAMYAPAPVNPAE